MSNTPRWRWKGSLVGFVQWAIGTLAPPLHSLRWKIFILLLAGSFLPALYFLWQAGRSLERSHLRPVEPGINTPLLLNELAIPAAIALALALAFSFALSAYLTGVIRDLVVRAERISAGDRGVVLATWTKSELGDLARALEVMRQKIEGRAYLAEMASTLSHELKTPLAAIHGAADILEGAEDEATRRRFSESIRAEVGRLTGIASNFLELSRIETAPASAFAPAGMVEVGTDIESAYTSRAEVLGVTFRMECKGDAGSAPMATDSLRRVIVCILDNAFAFTPRGGSVVLRIAPGNIVVSDNGCGMDAETAAKAFDRFFTTVNPLTGRRGSGLGLAVAKSLVERAGGTIRIKSSPGGGTGVEVDFPLE
jgi:two-component system sensor histidine kinase CreC